MSNMADSSSENMAVTVDNHLASQSVKDTVSREEIEQRSHQTNSTRPVSGDNLPKKKGTFKITSVKLNDAEADSMDDLDESHTEVTEDVSSEILDISKTTDQDTPSEDIPLPSQGLITDPDVPSTISMNVIMKADSKEKTGTDMHSRFRVVKIETKEPFKRGRWFCHDFLDPQQPVPVDKTEIKPGEDINSGSSSACSSVNYVHGVDDPAKNPLLAGATGTIPVAVPISTSQVDMPNKHESFQPIHPASNSVGHTLVSGAQVPSSQAYYSDSSQSERSSQQCQNIHQSHSSQSIQPPQSKQQTDNIPNSVTTGSVLPQIIPSHLVDANPQSNIFVPQQPGQSSDHLHTASVESNPIQNVYSNIQSSGGGASMPSVPPSSIAMSVPGQPQASTYPSYVHLGTQQVANTGVPTIPSIASVDNIGSSGVPSDTSAAIPSLSSELSDSLQLRFPTGSVPLNEVLDKDLKETVNMQGVGLLPPLVAAVGTLAQSPDHEDTSESGSSTVAIDNKIEQAMDLVKSHLMYAVREEVEVLKEQIKELSERNTQLEYENSILKAAASQETLSKLSQPRQPPASSS